MFDKSMTVAHPVSGGKRRKLHCPERRHAHRYWAFQNDTQLSSVTMPNSVTDIGYRAFSDCTSLTNVTIPNSVTTMGSYGVLFVHQPAQRHHPRSVTKIVSGRSLNAPA